MKEGLTIISQRKFYTKILEHTTSPETYIPGTRPLLWHKTNSHCNEDSSSAEEMRRPAVACHSYQVLHNWLITDYDTDIPHWIWCVCVRVHALARLHNSFTCLWRRNTVYSVCHLLRLLRKWRVCSSLKHKFPNYHVHIPSQSVRYWYLFLLCIIKCVNLVTLFLKHGKIHQCNNIIYLVFGGVHPLDIWKELQPHLTLFTESHQLPLTS
jgi:hypothetical protein